MSNPEVRRATVRRLIAESYLAVLERVRDGDQATDEIETLNNLWEDTLREAKLQACRHAAKYPASSHG